MRWLSLDYDPVYGDNTVRSSFDGDLSVFDFDAVIWDPQASLETYVGTYPEYYQGLPSLSDNTSVRIREDAKRRRAEFVEFINAGRPLIVVTRPPQQCYVATGTKEFSGTGRNRVTTRHVGPFDLMSAVPSDCEFKAASGNRIDVVGEGALAAVLRKYKTFMRYTATLGNPPGSIMAKVVGTERVVAAVQRSKSEGLLILVPAFDFEDKEADDEDEDKDAFWIPEAAEFQRDLASAINELTNTDEIARPQWAARYETEPQREVNAEVLKQTKRVETARASLTKSKQKAAEMERRNQLYLGFGRTLEIEVKEVLELLGGTVTEPPPGRDDWRVEFPEANAVVEVKGLTKSAAEKHAAQLEKWVAAGLEETGKAPKGILVANTWRDTPLNERTKDDFPVQMIPYSTSREHCLVTGLQLFVIRSEIEADPKKAQVWRKRILETSGVFTDARDWKSVIQESESVES